MTAQPTDFLNLPVNFSANLAAQTPAEIEADLLAQVKARKLSNAAVFQRCVAATGDAVKFMGTLNVVKGGHFSRNRCARL